MQRIEGLAGIEPDDHRLGGAEQAPAIQHVAQAATGEVLADHEPHIVPVPLGAAVVQHRSQIRVVQLGQLADGGGDGTAHFRPAQEVRVDDLEHHIALQLLVDGLERGGLDRASTARAKAIATGQKAGGGRGRLFVGTHHDV